ncbi:hypothetical protein LTR09_007111 [Extremus antarcticus]|uniref:F-box domain-containing protein n=1 Tax=Extremus antarcticus TaxID=702011 RepID=A0AAJ0G837_9PEZI|nr:hypothetical protein LTR09_007111 [Extremus antarcticus]
MEGSGQGVNDSDARLLEHMESLQLLHASLSDVDVGSVPLHTAIQLHSCTAEVCAVKKCLETTELLERILVFLPTSDILTVRWTNRKWNATIQESPELRLHFFTYSQWNRPGSDFQLLPVVLPGLTIERGATIHLGQWVTITITAEAARRILLSNQPHERADPKTVFDSIGGPSGSQGPSFLGRGSSHSAQKTAGTDSTLDYADLFVTQPPLPGMQVFQAVLREPTIEAPAQSAEDTGLENDAQALLESLQTLPASELGRPRLRCGAGRAPQHPTDFTGSSAAPRRLTGPVNWRRRNFLPSMEGASAEPEVETRPRAKISCATGIKLGFLAVTALDIINSPTAAASEQKDVRVVFKAIMSFTEPEAAPKKRPSTQTITWLG